MVNFVAIVLKIAAHIMHAECSSNRYHAKMVSLATNIDLPIIKHMAFFKYFIRPLATRIVNINDISLTDDPAYVCDDKISLIKIDQQSTSRSKKHKTIVFSCNRKSFWLITKCFLSKLH